jgi:hypothetical protein
MTIILFDQQEFNGFCKTLRMQACHVDAATEVLLLVILTKKLPDGIPQSAANLSVFHK